MRRAPLGLAAAGRGYSALVIAANVAALAILAAAAAIPPLPRPCSAIAGMARDCAAILAIFFVPGTALVLSLGRRERIPLSGLLARGFAVNVLFLTAATTLPKLAGIAMSRTALLAAMAVGLAASLAARPLRSRRLPTVAYDLPLPPPASLAVAAAFILLFTLLGGYTFIEPRDHWLVEQVRNVHFPDKPAALSLRYEGDGISRDGRFVDLPRGEGRVLISSRGPGAMRVRIGYLVRSSAAGEFTIAADGVELKQPVPQPFFDSGRPVLFQKQAVATMELAPAPGVREVRLRFADASGAPAPCTLLDFTGLSRAQFLAEFGKRYRFVNCILMYDIMEARDFASNLVRRPYIYHSPGTPEMPGYAVTNPPMSYIFASFGYALMGSDMAALNKVAYALLVALLFTSLQLAGGGRGARLSMTLGTMNLAAVLTAGVSLHFMTHFMMLCIMLAFGFMIRKEGGWFMLFALVGCFSGWAGFFFCAAGILCYALLLREWRWAAKQLGCLIFFIAIFLFCLLAYGYAKGVLKPWIDIILWENFSRFGAVLPYRPGSRLCFFGYACLCSGFLALALPLRNDREGYFFLLFSVVYCATLLAAYANMWKVHYLSTLVFPLMVFGGRGLSRALKEGERAARIAAAAAASCSAAGFAYLFSLAMQGRLLLF